MKNRMILQSLLLIFIVSLTYSQEQKQVPLFAIVHLGVLKSDREDFLANYGSKTGFVFGGGLGIQVSNSIALVVKATYFHKSGVPLIQTYSYNLSTGITTLVSENKEGTASYTQWLVNAGLQISIFNFNQFSVAANGGVLYSVVSEELNDAPALSYSANGKGIYGYFIGLNIEKKYLESPFSPFIEIQYNLTRSGLTEVPLPVGGHFGGMNISLGCIYNFHK